MYIYRCDSHVEVCDDDAVVGYIESTYTPEAMTSMDEQFDAELIAGVDSEYINSTVYIDCSLYLGELCWMHIKQISQKVNCVSLHFFL